MTSALVSARPRVGVMKATVTTRELRELKGPAREARFATMSSVLRAPPNGEVRELDEEIASLASQLKVDASQVRNLVAHGQLRETSRVCDLLMLLKLRDRLGAAVK